MPLTEPSSSHSREGGNPVSERRNLSNALARIESRAEEGKPRIIAGYAAVFWNPADARNTEINLWGDVYERIMPGCFDRALAERHDVRGLFNHDPDHVLGRTASGTCRLKVDAVGLAYELDENQDDPEWKSIYAKVSRKDIDGSSFAFWVREETWREDDNRVTREILDVDLIDVGPVTFPWYTGASSGVRAVSPEEVQRLQSAQASQSRRSRKRIELDYRLRQLGMK